jgi:predicted nucleic-acid-binding Zn-ribbon protein
MSTFGQRLRKALVAGRDANKPGAFQLEGKTVTCPHCGNQEFAIGRAQLNTAGLTFLDLDWANKSAHTLLCTECGRIEWFAQRPEKL